MSTMAANAPTVSDPPIRRLDVYERREQSRRSDALKQLLEEFAVWTAPWTGFPLSRADRAR